MPESLITVTTGDTTFFPDVEKVQFEGPQSDNPLAYKYYNENSVLRGRTLSDHLRFAIAYWHSFCNAGSDPFGLNTKKYPWLTSKDPYRCARQKMDAAMEFITKLGLKHYCFHDYDLIDEGPNLFESEKRLAAISDYALKKQEVSGVGPLWGTANLFSHPRYMNGAATNPDFNTVAYAGAQVKMAIDTTIILGGKNYVFWGGREGYLSLLNTDMKREIDHLAEFLHMAKNYARSQGFKGHFFIEPKPMEPTKHQYDFDASTVIGFLREYGLIDDFKLNLEFNHATLAHHTMAHEMQVASDNGLLGSIDANRGDYQNGWDTDQFPNNLYELVEVMLVLLEAGGLRGGGVNFDAKTRRNSTDPIDLFYGHIGAIDTFSRALIIADKILDESDYLQIRMERYDSFDSAHGLAFETGNLLLSDLYEIAHTNRELKPQSAHQELFENMINDFLK